MKDNKLIISHQLLWSKIMSIENNNSQFLQDMGVSAESVERSGIAIDVLKEIAEDYKENELTLLDEAEYIAKKIQRCNAVHSVRWRIKSVSHVIKKIVRKLNEVQLNEKYKSINVGNYKAIITDLIGVRAIYLFKSDWEEVHNHILSRWVIKEDEPVIIYHREGDVMDIYSHHLDCEQKVHFYNYRSIHYLVPATNIHSVQIYCEVQTRTIFEEGWSEIDHKVRYPDYSEDENLMSYLTIFNRLAGSADEMGSYVNELIALIKKNNELEEERSKKEKQFLEEKEKLQDNIKKLSTHEKNIDEVQEQYEKLIDVQRSEIESLKEELKSQTSENIRLNRNEKNPVVVVLGQVDKTNTKDCYEGDIEIEVIRSNKFATFTGHFNPRFETIPIVEVITTETTCPNTDISDLTIKIGVGQPHNFNVHIFNKKLGRIEEGNYKFHFKAYESKSLALN
ncbi:RelA/SpoT domain protein [Providencia rustigianii DSM 4541]|uniref:RelA/SpoT domain protein n=2 Tax=Providencia rustigianii TaxID=158850 RepID=D1NYY1_9GAMM|nr:RelA/SpoT domain protein [Providencia rustigianii DSM 4541]